MFYDRNDNGLYFKTDILANVALARNVNYDCKIQLTEAFLTIVKDL
jgi:hypothetical protein